MLVGQRLRVVTRNGTIPGVIARKPIHLLTDEESKQVPEFKALHIDIGAVDGDDARKRVRVGDVGGDRRRAGRGSRNGRLVSRALEQPGSAATSPPRRRGSWPPTAAPPADVVALAVTQEDAAFAGARTSAFAVQPDAAIVVDGTFATDQPGEDRAGADDGKHPLGSGPAITRGTTLHPGVFDLLLDVAGRRQEFRVHRLEVPGLRANGHRRGRGAREPRAPGDAHRASCRSQAALHAHPPSRLASLADIDRSPPGSSPRSPSGSEPGMSFEALAPA